jgi:hypothetical protein
LGWLRCCRRQQALLLGLGLVPARVLLQALLVQAQAPLLAQALAQAHKPEPEQVMWFRQELQRLHRKFCLLE